MPLRRAHDSFTAARDAGSPGLEISGAATETPAALAWGVSGGRKEAERPTREGPHTELSVPSGVTVKKWKVAAVPAPARVSQVAESDEVEARVARGGGGGSGAATQIVRVEPDGARLAVPERPRLRAR